MVDHQGNHTLQYPQWNWELISLTSSSLDESETSIKKFPGKVRYFGTLHIEDLTWISPKGRNLLKDDMKRRGLNLSLGE